MTHEKIMAELKAGKFRPVYLLQGEEPYFIDLISDFIQDNALTEDERSFNQSVHYGLDSDVGTVVSEARRFPMMADRQVVIVKEAQKLKGLIPAEESDKAKKKDEPEKKGELQHYCESPLKTTVLVICHKYKKLDTRKKKAKDLLAAIEQSGGVVFTSERIKDWKVAEWIQERVAAQGYRIDPRTAAILAEYLGNDLGKIINELEKLYISMKQGDTVTPDLVERNIGISKDYNIFELQNALTSKDVTRVNRIITHYAYNPKEHPIQMLLPVLHSFFFKVGLMHFAQKSKGALDPARVLGVPPFFLKDYQKAASTYNEGKLKAVMSYLRDADNSSKGVDNPSTGHGDIMKELMFKILH